MADSLSIGGVTSNTSRITEAMKGMIMIAGMMPAEQADADRQETCRPGTWPISRTTESRLLM